MTNVPDKIRDAWKDLYILFDTNFNMDGSDKAWEKYWSHATQLIKKYGDEIPLLEMTEAIARFLDVLSVGNHSLMWDKGEQYPHPRKEMK